MALRLDLLRYVAARLALAPVMLWIIASLVFLLLRVAPGDPIDALLGLRATPAARESLRIHLGLDRPLAAQYFTYLHDLLQGHLGQSLASQEAVTQIIGTSLPATIELGVMGLMVGALLGLAVGLSGAAKPEGPLDLAGRLFGIGTYALPPFWAAMVLQLCLAVWLHWLPVGGRFPPTLSPPEQPTGFYVINALLQGDGQALTASLRHLALPAFTLGLLLSGIFERVLRLNLRRALRADYVEAARSRGLREWRIITGHALPNALLPLLTLGGITMASLIGGALLIEVTFSWPGVALRLHQAISQRDYPVVQGVVVVVAALVVAVTVIVDVLVAWIDPRVRF